MKSRYPIEIIQAAARAAHRELSAQPASYLRLPIARGQRRLVQVDASGELYPVCWSTRTWRMLVCRPVARQAGVAR